jgi:4-aminobutyrate--pyruvate transaminase
MGAGGVVVPPKTYFPKIQAVLQKHDIAFIADEVICGFGRTGNWWGSQTLGAKPTTVSMAKAITSAYFPLGALTVPEHVYEAMVAESEKIGVFAHGFTYSGHPVGCAVALAAIAIYERTDIVGHVQKVAPTFQRRLRALVDHPLAGEARGVGLLGGLELVKDKRTRQSFESKIGLGAKVSALAQAEGLICRAVNGDTISLCPPLIITEDEINTMFDMLQKALDTAYVWAKSEGHLT